MQNFEWPVAMAELSGASHRGATVTEMRAIIDKYPEVAQVVREKLKTPPSKASGKDLAKAFNTGLRTAVRNGTKKPRR